MNASCANHPFRSDTDLVVYQFALRAEEAAQEAADAEAAERREAQNRITAKIQIAKSASASQGSRTSRNLQDSFNLVNPSNPVEDVPNRVLDGLNRELSRLIGQDAAQGTADLKAEYNTMSQLHAQQEQPAHANAKAELIYTEREKHEHSEALVHENCQHQLAEVVLQSQHAEAKLVYAEHMHANSQPFAEVALQLQIAEGNTLNALKTEMRTAEHSRQQTLIGFHALAGDTRAREVVNAAEEMHLNSAQEVKPATKRRRAGPLAGQQQLLEEHHSRQK